MAAVDSWINLYTLLLSIYYVNVFWRKTFYEWNSINYKINEVIEFAVNRKLSLRMLQKLVVRKKRELFFPRERI